MSSADYDRVYEYRLAPSRNDLRKYIKSRRTYKRKGEAGHSDPTANRAVRNVMYTSTSEGY